MKIYELMDMVIILPIIIAVMGILMPGSFENKVILYLAVAIWATGMMTYSVAKYVYKKYGDHHIGPDNEDDPSELGIMDLADEIHAQNGEDWSHER